MAKNTRLYNVRAFVLETHLQHSYPVIVWKVPSWEERFHPSGEELPPELLQEMNEADGDGLCFFALGTFSINGCPPACLVYEAREADVFERQGLVKTGRQVGRTLADAFLRAASMDDEDESGDEEEGE